MRLAEALYYSWCEKLFEAGRPRLGKEEHQGERELKPDP